MTSLSVWLDKLSQHWTDVLASELQGAVEELGHSLCSCNVFTVFFIIDSLQLNSRISCCLTHGYRRACECL